jgi:hypothetical protein
VGDADLIAQEGSAHLPIHHRRRGMEHALPSPSPALDDAFG